MKNIFYLTAISIIFSSCVTPQKALDKGDYLYAFRLASLQIEQGKDIEENTVIIIRTIEQIVDHEFQRNEEFIHSSKVKNWIRVQNRYYDLLEDIGHTNQLIGGEISTYYDEVCNAKQDIDYQITSYYYDNGQELLTRYDKTASKQAAQEAYYQFTKSLETGGHLYFDNLEELILEAEELGTIYYTSNHINLNHKMFFKYLPANADFEADCRISLSKSPIRFSRDETLNEASFSKKVQVDTEEIVNADGVVTKIPIYGDIEAVVKTYTTTLTASQTSWITVDNITGQCNLSSHTFTTQASDSYEEIKIEGNKDALDHLTQEISGTPAFFRSNLEDDLEDAVEDDIASW